MATSSSPKNIAASRTLRVPLQSEPVVTGQVFFVDNFSDYETDPDAWDNIAFDKHTGSPNYNTLKAKGINCSDSLRSTPRRISDICGAGGDGTIPEEVTPVQNSAIGNDAVGTVMRMRYPAIAYDDTTSAEFEWQLVDGFFFEQGQGTTELWMQHDLYVPENFHLRDTSQGTDLYGYNANQKVATLYAGGYSGEYPTMIMGGGPSQREYGMPAENTMYATQQMKKTDAIEGLQVWVGKDRGQTVPYIYSDFDRGHWMRITYRLKLESAPGANDGIHEAWIQRHLGEADTYTDKLFEEFEVNTHYDETYKYLDGGVVFGYSNIGFNEEVNLLIDNLIITDDGANLDPASITVSQPPTPQNRMTYLTGITTGDVTQVRRPGGMVDGDTLVMIILGRANTNYSDLSFIDGDGAGFTAIYNSRDWDSTARDAQCAVLVKKITDADAEPLWYTLDFAQKYGAWEVICLSRGGRGDCINNSLVQETLTPESNPQTSPMAIDLAGVTAREGDDILWISATVMETFSGGLTQNSLTFPAQLTPTYKSLSPRETFGIAIGSNVAAGATGTLSGSFSLTDNTINGVPHGVVIALPKEST